MRKVRQGDVGLNCRILHLRTNLNLSLRDIETAIGIDISTLSRAERNFDIQLSTAIKIAEFFERPLTEIWDSALSLRNGKKAGTK